jgi:hypothetical protein
MDPTLSSKRITDTVDWHPTLIMLPPRKDIPVLPQPAQLDNTLPIAVPLPQVPPRHTTECGTQTDVFDPPEVKRVKQSHTETNTIEPSLPVGVQSKVHPKRKNRPKITDSPLARPRRTIAVPKRFQAYSVKTCNRIISKQKRMSALTAVDLDIIGNPLKYGSAIHGPDAEKWLLAAAEEFDRLVDSETGKFISHDSLPRGRTAAYYNPQVRTKEKNGNIEYRVRGR